MDMKIKDIKKNLTIKTDKQLISLVRNKNSSAAFEEICRRYENVYYRICYKYASSLLNVGIDPNEVYQEKNYIIYHCVKTFKTNKKTKLSSWIGNFARYLCLNSIHSKKFIIPDSQENEIKDYFDIASTQNYFNPLFNTEDVNYVTHLLGQIKDKRISDVFHYRYFHNDKRMIWTDIGKKLHLSPQTIINLHRKGIDLIKNKMESKNISDNV